MTVEMGSRIRLPALEIVRKWTNKDLTEWLQDSQLGECIPTFQERNIDGATLLDMPRDKIITELSDVKIKQRMQVAKCVTECKSQAAEAKKVVSSLARSRKKRAQVAAGSAGEPEDFESADDWSSDEFDSGDEDEDRDYHANHVNEDGISGSDFASDNVSTNGPESVASSDSSGQYNDVVPLDLRPAMPGRTGVWTVKGPCNGRELDTATPEPSVVLIGVSPLHSEGTVNHGPSVLPKSGRSPIPKPPASALDQLGKLTTGMVNNGVQKRSIPKLQRPPSQPPAPPAGSAKNRAEPETPGSEDGEYEIPISGMLGQQSGPQTLVRVLPAAPVQFQYQQVPNGQTPSGWTTQSGRPPDTNAVHQNTSGTDDTYEPVDKPEEETYEAVDDPRRISQPCETELGPTGPTPCLPPRKPASLPPHLLVPPLPEKPPKMVSPPPTHSPPAFTPPLPSKGLNSSKSMSQLVSKVRSKLSGRRESNVSAKDVEAASLEVQTNANGAVTVMVNGTSPSGTVVSSVVPTPPALPRAPPSYSPVPRPPPPPAEESCSVALRPLPPVPSSQARAEEEILDRLPYYWDVERQEAEQQLLALREDDTYLVRPGRRAGPDNPYTLTLIHNGRPFHLNIRLRPDRKYALGRKKGNEMVFQSVSALVSHHQQHPIYLSANGENVGTGLLRRHP